MRKMRWRNAHDPAVIAISPMTRRWLLSPSSMTKQLQKASQNHFRVRLLSQTWQKPLPCEALRLGIAFDQWVVIRTVELLCREQIWVYGRTVFPAECFTGSMRRLRYLGERPLGDVLFKDPKLQRSDFEVALLSPDQKASIGRRSVFRSAGKSLLLTELFSPSCVAELSRYK
jgi:chorismate--pyruvate lyase